MNGPTEVPSGWVITFPPPAALMNMNDRKNWRATLPLKKDWRDGVFFHCRNVINSKTIPPHLTQVALIFDFPVMSTKIRRDPHNYAPTVKAAVDGMVKAGLLIDDSSEHVEVVDSWFHRRSQNPNVIIHIRKKEG